MKKVCIYAQDDGRFTVELEPQGESMDGMGEEVDVSMGGVEPAGQVFESADEALDAARSLLVGDDPGMGKPMMEGEEDFVAGFKQARGIDQGF